MKKAKESYHHGNLRAALLTAGEAVLERTGTEKFSLREVARQVGVSHSAPAHHFGDARGLLVAMATDGFRRLLQSMENNQKACDDTPTELLVASGLGYLDFALSAPALFRLMFGPDYIAFDDEDFCAAAQEAYPHLEADLARVRQGDTLPEVEVRAEILAHWSVVHGYANLLVSGLLADVRSLPDPERRAFARLILSRFAAAGKGKP